MLTSLLPLQISHIIREIRQFQQTAYKIDLQPKVKEVIGDIEGWVFFLLSKG